MGRAEPKVGFREEWYSFFECSITLIIGVYFIELWSHHYFSFLHTKRLELSYSQFRLLDG